MPVPSQIVVPSPEEIKAQLFPHGKKKLNELPATWQAQVLLTPPGGSTVAGTMVDELLAGILTYDSTGSAPILRAQLFGLESLNYHDLLFGTANGANLVWPLKSDPAKPTDAPTGFGAPLQSNVTVPAVDAVSSHFVHAGSWKSVGQLCDAFSGKKAAQASTWAWQDSQTGVLRRLMNIDTSNDFGWAVFGSFYFVDFVSFNVLAESPLPALIGQAPNSVGPAHVSMRTFQQFATALAGVSLAGSACTFADIQSVLPGLSPAAAAPNPPKWTNTVYSQCYMIGQDPYRITAKSGMTGRRGVKSRCSFRRTGATTTTPGSMSSFPREGQGQPSSITGQGKSGMPLARRRTAVLSRCPFPISWRSLRVDAAPYFMQVPTSGTCRSGVLLWAIKTSGLTFGTGSIRVRRVLFSR